METKMVCFNGENLYSTSCNVNVNVIISEYLMNSYEKKKNRHDTVIILAVQCLMKLFEYENLRKLAVALIEKVGDSIVLPLIILSFSTQAERLFDVVVLISSNVRVFTKQSS